MSQNSILAWIFGLRQGYKDARPLRLLHQKEYRRVRLGVWVWISLTWLDNPWGWFLSFFSSSYNILRHGCWTLDWQHLLDPVEDFAVELERLLKKHLVLQALLIWDRNQAGKVLKGPVEATLESEEHALGLLRVVPIPSFGHPDELVQLLLRKMIGRAQEEERPLSKLLWLAATSGNGE